MSKAYCLLNHELTQNQVTELREKFKAEKIEYPPAELSKMWSQIPALEEIDAGTINAVTGWLSSAREGDALIAQGEFGATFMIVDYALKHHMIPLHAVTKRVAHEQRDGEIVSRQYVFEHICFRRYRYYDAP